MATPTTTLPSVSLAALHAETAHASAGKRLFRTTTTAVIVVLALPLMKRKLVVVEA
jgi:hypothetical protein